MAQMGRKPHEPTEKDRLAAETMSSYGIPELDIARVIGVNVHTLRKWYQYELETGHIKANSMVAQSLYQKAIGNSSGAVTACIFWLKVRAGWVEPRPWEQPTESKKELQAKAAAMAGGSGTGWASDLDVEIPAN
jgi:hypothetical protein